MSSLWNSYHTSLLYCVAFVLCLSCGQPVIYQLPEEEALWREKRPLCTCHRSPGQVVNRWNYQPIFIWLSLPGPNLTQQDRYFIIAPVLVPQLKLRESYPFRAISLATRKVKSQHSLSSAVLNSHSETQI